MRRTDNGAEPPAQRAYRLPEDGPLPDLPLYKRLIGDGITAADGRAVASIMSPPGAWPSGRPPDRRHRSSPRVWSASSRPAQSARPSRPSCASMPDPALTLTSRRPPGSWDIASAAAPTSARSARTSAPPVTSSTDPTSCSQTSTPRQASLRPARTSLAGNGRTPVRRLLTNIYCGQLAGLRHTDVKRGPHPVTPLRYCCC
jgi:hypothetical protein